MFRAIVVIVFLFVFVQTLAAQQPSVGTTVQLPTISSFNVNTVVSVPDGGTMYLGGIRRGSEFSRRRLGSLARSRSVGGPGVSVSARLLIGSEIDAELERRGRLILARKARPDIHGTKVEKAKASFLARNLGRGLR